MLSCPPPDDRAARKASKTAKSGHALIVRLRTALLPAVVLLLGACADWQPAEEASRRGDLLRNNMAVAEAALAAGQPEAARRLYLSLSDRFEHAPEPFLGLGHIAFDDRNFAAAERYFQRAAERAEEARAIRTEARLGGGRAALAQGKLDAARRHFEEAREAGRGSAGDAWAVNGLAVAATIGGDREAAEGMYREALRLSSKHPRISANFLRMLLAAGMVERASKIHAEHDASYWLDGDGEALSRMIEDARRAGHGSSPPRLFMSGLLLHLTPSTGRPANVARFDPAPTSALLLRIGAAPASAMPPISAATTANPAPARERSTPSGTSVNRGARRSAGRPTVKLVLGQSRRLHLPGEATSVLVASPEVADVQLLSPKMVYIIGKAVGRTSVTVLQDEERVRHWTVSVVLDIEPIRGILANEPELQGVRAKRAGRGVALTGEVASVAHAERALRLAAGALPKDTPIDNGLRVTGAQQVNLEVQIAEVQRSVTEDFGINWEAFRVRGDDFLGFRIGRLLPGLGGGAGAAPFPGGLRATIDGEVAPGLGFSSTAARTRVAGMVDALATAGLANVLARPNVTAVSGESASIFSGGEYPLPTGFEDGVIVFEYKKYGILLDFVPTVIDTGRIVLNVRPEVSEPSLNQAVQVVGVNVPVINVRRAETTVEVGDGESIVIAGLFRNASNTREAGLPGLKDIPVLGALFGHRSVRSDELELIVIVTARLVPAGKPLRGAETPSPPRVDGYHY